MWPGDKVVRGVLVGALAFGLIACQQKIPKEALQLSAESLADRQLQTRLFETNDEAMLLSASAALLQDLGFMLDESETGLGVIVASKDRDATEAGQVVMAVAFTVLIAALGGDADVSIDDVQKLRASVVTKPIGEDRRRIAVRVTFQRIVWNNKGQISRQERLNEPESYQEFFSKLSKAVFLEAHEI